MRSRHQQFSNEVTDVVNRLTKMSVRCRPHQAERPCGDTSAILGIFPTPAPPGSDLLPSRSHNLTPGTTYQAAFTINTDNGSRRTPRSSWYVAMKIVRMVLRPTRVAH